MSTRSIQALRRANPRAAAGFAEAVESSAREVRIRLANDSTSPRPGAARRLHAGRVSFAAAGLVVVVVAGASLALGSLGGGRGVENAVAAVTRAARVTAASAERSGTASVRMTHGGALWAGKTVRWNGDDVAISRDATDRPRGSGDSLLVVDGMLYGPDPEVEGGWIAMGSPTSIDPDSGTTPGEYLAAVREDLGGATLRRITAGMTSLTTRDLGDGSTVYSGKVAAGLVARETGFKEGHAIRVFPFGYVARGEAANADALLDVAVETGGDGLVRSLVVTWGAGGAGWSYVVTYRDLGNTAAPLAPANARSLLRERALPKPAQR